MIRTLLAELYDSKVAQAVRIQYGGSVKPDKRQGTHVAGDIGRRARGRRRAQGRVLRGDRELFRSRLQASGLRPEGLSLERLHAIGCR